MNVPFITYEETADKLNWTESVAAIRNGHKLPEASIKDIFLGPADGTLLSRSAYIKGLGYGVKSTTVFSGNSKAGLPSVQGAMLVFEPTHGELSAIIESRLVTEYKTASDSVLGASILSSPDSRNYLIIGAGTVARSLIKSYGAFFRGLEKITIWARKTEQAQRLASEFNNSALNVTYAEDLPVAAGDADIISTATLAHEPVLKYEWLKPGTHVDLIGAYKADMREADDELISKGKLFVDSRCTTIDHIGELMIPISNGIITRDVVQADFYDLIKHNYRGRVSDSEITVFKNGGGAHMDLMMASYITQTANPK